MERKLVQHGPHSLGISVPARWLKEHQLAKGDPVHLQETENGLLLRSSKTPPLQEAHICIEEMTETLLRKTIHQLYEEGYLSIRITFSTPFVSSTQGNPIPLKSRLNYLASRLIGMELVSWNRNSAEMQVMVLESSMPLRSTIRKTFLMTEEFMHTVRDHVNGKKSIDEYQGSHDAITKFVSLAKRQIRLSRGSRSVYVLLIMIDKVADYLRNLCETLPKKLPAQSSQHIQDINECFRLFSKGYWEQDRAILNTCLRKRKDTYDSIFRNKERCPAVLMYTGMLEIILMMVENSGLEVPA